MRPESEELLRSVVSGDVPPDAPEVLERSGSDSGFEEELASTLSTLRRLEAAREVRRQILAEAANITEAPGEEGVRTVVRERLAGDPAKRRWRRLVWLAAATVLVAGAVIVLRGTRTHEAPADVRLGPAELVLIEPTPTGASFERFAWTSSAKGGWFEVLVTDLEGNVVHGGRSRRIEAVGDEWEWRPAKGDTEQWPDTIAWELRWFDAGGSLADSISGTASR